MLLAGHGFNYDLGTGLDVDILFDLGLRGEGPKLSSSDLSYHLQEGSKRTQGNVIHPPGQENPGLVLTSTKRKENASCPICGLVTLKKTLDRHIQSNHQRKLPISCSFCGKTFARKDIRKRHELEQHYGDTELAQCVHCGNQVRQRVLKDHWNSQRCRRARTLKTSLDFSQRFGPETVTDGLPVCIRLFNFCRYGILEWDRSASSRFGPCYPIVSSSSPLPEHVLGQICKLRSLAICLTQSMLEKAWIGVRELFQIMVLGTADKWIFGGHSEEAKTHSRYVISMYDSAQSQQCNFYDVKKVIILAKEGMHDIDRRKLDAREAPGDDWETQLSSILPVWWDLHKEYLHRG